MYAEGVILRFLGSFMTTVGVLAPDLFAAFALTDVRGSF